MIDPGDLPDGWWERAESIAGRCARNTFVPQNLPYHDRFDVALDGIVAEILDNGWPEDSFKPLFRAAGSAIKRARHEHEKHLRYWAHWHEPTGCPDSIAEAVTDKIGVHQLTHAFTNAEWEAVWALARVMAWDGGNDEAAALLGISRAAFSMRLRLARRRASPLWVAPGDTPPARMWASSRGTRANPHSSRRSNWVQVRNASARREDRREDLVKAVCNGTAKLADVLTLSELTNENIKVGTIRKWIKDGDLVERGIVEERKAYSVDEFVRLAIQRGRLGNDPRKQAA